MEFHEAANFLFERRGPPELGTDRTAALLERVGEPQANLRAVRIAGTNGKGSTARMVERVLREAGLDVGLFTSPHLEDVRESIRVNGRKVTREAVAVFVASVEEYVVDRAAAGDGPTYFELLTALACHEFDRQDVDVAVFEVGMGGERDATAVVDPAAGAVTSVDVDHAALLGEDVETLASELAGVAPDDGPLVTAATGDALAAVETATDEVLPVADVTDVASTGSDGAAVSVTYEGIDGIEAGVTIEGPDWGVETKLPLLGAHQARNAGVAAALVHQVAAVDDEELAVGLRNAHFPGRFEVMEREPLVVLDGAHNPAACERTAETLAAFDPTAVHLVVGAMADKDLAGIAAALPDPETVVACRADRDRAASADVVASAFEGTYPDATVTTRSDVVAALERARSTADSGDCVLVTGSLAVVAEARSRWTRPVVPVDGGNSGTVETTLTSAAVPAADRDDAAADATHYVVRTRLWPRAVRRLREATQSVGGECTVSGVDERHEEPVDVVVSATRSEFQRLTDALETESGTLADVAVSIRDRLDLDGDGGGSGGGQSPDGRPGVESSTDDRDYPWTDGTAVMGILNATPDSFHDGGEYDTIDAAVARAEEVVDAGADVVDVGGESTRPGADPVPVEEEKRRVVPVVEAIADCDALVSVDTRKAAVARAALDAGADVLNDVSGLADPEMRLVATEYDVPVVVMHSIDTPVVPDNDVEYDDVVTDVLDQLTERVLLAEKAGLDREQILLDPGIGFGKTPAENFALLGRLAEFRALGCPVLVGHSHKSLFAHVDRDPGDRYEATVAATALAARQGVDVVRVHDVEANVAAVDVSEATDPDAFDL